MWSDALNRKNAQSIIETVVGIIFMIPVVLLLFDIGVLVLANMANDNLAKQACSAAAKGTPVLTAAQIAAGQIAIGDEPSAKAAALFVVANFQSSPYVQNLSLIYINYHPDPPGTQVPEALNGASLASFPSNSAAGQDPGVGNVSVVTQITVTPPVPFPGFNTARTFQAKAVEPIVSVPPS